MSTWCRDGSHIYTADPERRLIAQLCYQGDKRDGELHAMLTAAPDLLEALKLVWKMFDDGRIVRNIANDGKPDWALKMLEFTKELSKIQTALDKAEGRA